MAQEKTTKKTGGLSIEDESLYTKFLLSAFFMFIIPLLLALYLIFVVLVKKDDPSNLWYIRLIIFWMVASGVFGYIIIRRNIKAILAIIKKAKIISEGGDIEQKISVLHDDELKDLAAAFNRMTSDLEKKISELEYSRSLTRELFQKIGHAITSSQKLEALMALLVQSLRKVLRGEAGFIALYDTSSGRLYLRSYSGPQKDLEENMELSDNKGVIGFVIKNKKPMVIKKGGMKPAELVSSEEEKLVYTTMLCVPIIDKDTVKGVIGVSDLADTEKIETDDLFLMENIAGQIATSVENFELNKDIEETYYQTLLMLARVVEAKDTYTTGHLERVSKYVEKMADKMRMDAESKKVLSGGAILHDLGKVGVQDDVLKKEGKYTKDELELMKQHSIIGENILKPLRSMSRLASLVRHHHEAYDGSGYPDGLRGEDIPLSSRILAVADIYDALTSDRPYRKAMSKEEAIKIIKSYEGTKLDPKLTQIFIDIVRDEK